MMKLVPKAGNRFRVKMIVALFTFAAWPVALSAQWVSLPLPDTPRTADGAPDLTAPAPRTDDGKPDLSGIWRIVQGINTPDANPARLPARISYFMPQGAQIPLRAAAAALYQERSDNLGMGRPSERCLPHGIPDAMLYGGPMKIVQTRKLSIILFEEFNNYRQLHTDGRGFPQNDPPQPTWFGYSVGRWEEDTFVVETMGFNDQTWMDDSGLPHSDALRTTERFRRLDFGHLNLELTVDDPKIYTEPWSVSFDFDLWPDTELIENICENERDVAHLVGK